MIDWFLYSWDKNLKYALDLVADVHDDKMAYQPAAGMNHPAWVFCHLHAYHGVINALIQGKPFEDPINHKFGMRSKPDTYRLAYPSKASLIESFEQGHGYVMQSLREINPSRLEAEVPLERWSKMPNIGAALGYLMICHESTHLGQLSAWRRVQGMPSV